MIFDITFYALVPHHMQPESTNNVHHHADKYLWYNTCRLFI